jgi:hypothetical protein
VLSQVMALGGLTSDGATLSMAVPPPRDPFRSTELKARAGAEAERI